MAPENPDEIRQRIDSLYARAENDTGNFNATRARSAATRRRDAAPARRSAQRTDPALDAVTKQWFDAARASFGPTVAAVLPADRLPAPQELPSRGDADGPGALPLPSPAELPALPSGPGGQNGPLGLPGLPGPRALPELTGGATSAQDARPRLAVEAAGAGALGGGPLAELPPVRLPEGAGGLAETAVLPVAALPAAQEAAVQAPAPLPTAPAGLRRPSPAEFKARNQRKLGTARELMARRNTPAFPGAAAPDPLTDTGSFAYPAYTEPAQMPPVTDTGAFAALPNPADTGSFAVPGAYASSPGTGSYATPGTPAPPASPADTGSFATLGAYASSADTGSYPVPGVPAPPASPADTGSFATLGAYTSSPDTGSYAAPGTPAPTATPASPADTGGFAALGIPGSPADTGSFPAPGAYASPAGTGSFATPGIPASAAGTGSYAVPGVPASPADTGGLPLPSAAAPWTDTGSFSLGTPGVPMPPHAGPGDTGSFAVPAPSPESTHAGRAAKAIEFARAQLGKPCVWGATGPDSYDCSSLTQGAWRAAGVTLPRSAAQQALGGAPMTLAGIEPGDLVLFFDDDRHVGLYVGEGMMIHAPGPGATIREESMYGAGEQAIHRVIRPA
ncbi:NlpC/P60 family protein [Streptomyces sp. NPDC090108]|uniref:C40 family peptidase n=1 Tax=Streptomyces sp. NPDC090108 TaxID=3365947 RepID=UPI0037F81900